MIYKCNNCGRIYNLQPEYCECGNNEFQEVVQNFDYSSVKTDLQVEKDVDFLYNNSVQEQSQNYEQNNSFSQDLNNHRKSEMLAVIIFVIVLLTALIMLFTNIYSLFHKHNEKTATVEIETYLPSDVDEYWTDAQVDIFKQKENTNSVISPRKAESKAQNTVNVIPNKVESKKTNIVSKKNNEVSPKKKQEMQKTQIVSKENNNSLNKAIDSSKPLTVAKNTISAEEYLRYKNSLRNKLFANFPILTIQGQGVAKVAFSLSSEGKLTNRRFVSQSGNKSLDDAMYNMLMRVPAYYPPPSGYDGQEIVMQMEFNNGHYSFSYIN